MLQTDETRAAAAVRGSEMHIAAASGECSEYRLPADSPQDAPVRDDLQPIGDAVAKIVNRIARETGRPEPFAGSGR